MMILAMENKKIIKWRSKPQKQDYPAAASYLSLFLGKHAPENAAAKLESAEMAEFPVKDIFRASTLSLLAVSNSHVESDRTKIIRDEQLSPALAVQGQEKRQGDNRRRLSPSMRGLHI